MNAHNKNKNDINDVWQDSPILDLKHCVNSRVVESELWSQS